MTKSNGLDGVAEAIFAKGAATIPPIKDEEGNLHVLVPNGYDLERIPARDPALLRIQGSPRFHDAASFIAYVNRYKDGRTRLCAETSKQSGGGAYIKAIFDYHEPSKPSHCVHTAMFVPSYSEEWKKWTAVPTLPQAVFAEFVEENRRDIVKPDAAFLLDIVSKFKATKKIDYNSVVYQPNGDVTLGWDERTEGANGQPVTMPTSLEIGIPVFFKGPLFKINVFLRYRLADAKLNFTLKVDRADLTEQTAFDDVTTKVAAETEIEIYMGRL